jgi:4-amino-4-deoxy-L-arabinose transferase-like glycosyltransferase
MAEQRMRTMLRACFSMDSLLLFALCSIVFANFIDGQGARNPNTTSRLFLTLSIAESGSISIGDYGPLTEDRAERDGRYYSDKAPGMAFLALPVVVSARPLLALRSGGEMCAGPDCWFEPDGQTNPYYKALYYLTTVLTSVVITAAGVVLFRSFAIALYGERGAATFAALVLAFGTPLGAWATTFFEHAAVASWLLAGLVAAHWASRQPGGSLRAATAGVLVAAPLALALVTSYLTAVPVLLVAAYALLGAWHQQRSWLLTAASAAMATGALIVAPLLAYNWAAFGSPFSVGYGHLDGFEDMKEGLFGISWPNLNALRGVTIDPYRGLLWVAPIAILYPLGLVAMLREPRHRGLAALGAAVAAYYLLINSGYAYWEGGFSLGPRHMVPVLPFLMLAITALWVEAGTLLRSLMVALGLGGAAVNVMAMATTVTPDSDYPHPIAEIIIPRFLAGNVHSVIGTTLHIEGLASLLAFLLLATLLAAVLVLRNFPDLRRLW